MYSSHTPFPKFLHLPSINKTCLSGDINSMNVLVLTCTCLNMLCTYIDIHLLLGKKSTVGRGGLRAAPEINFSWFLPNGFFCRKLCARLKLKYCPVCLFGKLSCHYMKILKPLYISDDNTED